MVTCRWAQVVIQQFWNLFERLAGGINVVGQSDIVFAMSSFLFLRLYYIYLGLKQLVVLGQNGLYDVP
ncbi:hypothetical protein BCR42DRAFT_410242 [Absidia repens]|uniref:Uncharacterized protein n=1 Tax=Absidia repens TaxID=90262 RepID=A0A1X2INR9_9FUNG|nr:hypothetical protein BCR42DRAFT_410242 [Absidia repens]